MKRTVIPHDLDAFCRDCGSTVAIVSENTGIPEDELRRFAEGSHALSANDRLAILRELLRSAPDVEGDDADPLSYLRARLAWSQLVGEFEEEERDGSLD
jgi:hypothetical protein